MSSVAGSSQKSSEKHPPSMKQEVGVGPESTTRGSDIMQAKRRSRPRLTWLLFAGLALVVGGFVYRASVFMTAFGVLAREVPREEKTATLSSAMSSITVAEYIMAVGGLLIAGSGAALFARQFVGKRSSTSQDRGD